MRECIRRELSQCWPFHQHPDLWRYQLWSSQSDSNFYLPGESDRRLIQPGFLGIPYIRGDNLVERKAMLRFLELVEYSSALIASSQAPCLLKKRYVQRPKC